MGCWCAISLGTKDSWGQANSGEVAAKVGPHGCRPGATPATAISVPRRRRNSWRIMQAARAGQLDWNRGSCFVLHVLVLSGFGIARVRALAPNKAGMRSR